MRTRLLNIWDAVRSSYWFLPASMASFAAGLAFAMPRVDRAYASLIPLDAWWIYGGGAAGARPLLTAIIGSMISVTSVVFSITIVALALAAGQFGSRLLRAFMRDRANQLTLGTFIGTFIYALLVLRAVRGGEDNPFVPPLTITVAVLLVVVSVGVLIFFIHHIATSIQADSLIQSVSRELRYAIEQLYPQPPAEAAGEPRAEPPGAAVPEGPCFELLANRDDYVRLVDTDAIVELATRHDITVRLRRRPGDFVVEGGVLAEVWPATAGDDGLADKLREKFVLGTYRTLAQDAEFGVLQLVEIAVRALSPGINDPFTALTCIDRLTSALCLLATRDFPNAYRYDDGGTLRVIIDTTTFEGFVDAAYHQIRQNAGASVAVLMRLMESIAEVGRRARDAQARDVLLRHASLVMAAGEAAVPEARDLEDLRRRHTAAALALVPAGS